MGHGGAGPVIQEPVDTGNHHLDKAINKFYNCLSHTHEDPPTVQKADDCYYQTLGSNDDGKIVGIRHHESFYLEG
jgi:hypothetical protein